MKRLTYLFFAVGMMFSMVFISNAISSNNPFSTQAQSKVTVKRGNKGIVRRTYGGGKYVVRKTWNGTKYVSRKVWVGTKYVGGKTVQGTKYAAHKTKRGTKAVISRTKKIIY